MQFNDIKPAACSLIILTSLLSSCFHSDPHKNEETKVTVDMIAVPQGSGLLGDARVQIDYDFNLSKHEVTQAEFEAVMGFNPVKNANVGDSNPVVSVSYFDAVLFCNRLSLMNDLDTVYTYTALEQDSIGRVLSIGSLGAQLSRNGYRLPTEAEWEYVSRGMAGLMFPWGNDTLLADKYSWYSLNSKGTLHPVCSKDTTAHGFCDLSGNAMEFVQDWYGEVTDSVLLDYAGPGGPNVSQERIVKGGAYQSPQVGLMSTNRRDTYGVFSANRTDYIGFRIAQGVIGTPTYSNNNANPGSQMFSALVDRRQLRAFFGTSHVRTIWSTSEGILQWIEWNQVPVAVHKKETPVPAFHPVMSPNGEWIAYCTRKEGQSGESRVYVQRLGSYDPPSDSIITPSAAIPRWWVDPATKDTFLVYASSPMSNADSAVWALQTTWKRPIFAGKFKGPAEQLSLQGAFHDGLSADGTILATGYTSLRIQNQSDGQVKTLFPYQVCNVSMSPSGSSKILFLDFGSLDSNNAVGAPYGIHEYLFGVDPNSNWTWRLQVPAGRLGWDYTEWSNLNTYAIGTTFASSESRDQLHAINMETHEVLTLAQGVEFNTPSLWILPMPAMDANLELDSLFQYNNPNSVVMLHYDYKMRLIWEMHDSIETAFIGSSRMTNGINPLLFTKGGVCANFGYAGAETNSQVRLMREYILPHMPKLKTVVFSLDIDFLARDSSYFIQRVETSEGYHYDESHQFWQDGIPKGFSEYVAKIPMQAGINMTDLGQEIRLGKSWGNPYQSVISEWTNNPDAWKRTLDSLDALITDGEARGLRFVGVVFPLNPGFKDKPIHYFYGPADTATQTAIWARIEEIKQKHPKLHIADFHNNGNHDFGDEYADNVDHLNHLGGDRVTRKLDSLFGVWFEK